jgi:hypothetical protein
MPGQPNRESSIRYTDFIQAVRRYRPSDLLPAVAQVAIAYAESDVQQWRSVPPHALAAIARESLLNSNEHRANHAVSAQDVLRLVGLFNNTYDPDPGFNALAVMSRHAFEQFRYQEFDLGGLARTLLLLNHITNEPRSRVTRQEIEEWFGGPVDEVLRAHQIIWILVCRDGGLWLPRTTDDLRNLFSGDEALVAMLEKTPPETILTVADSMTVTQQEFRERYPHKPEVSTQQRRWAANPLHVTPLILLPDGRVVAPQPKEILIRATVGNLLHLVPSERREAFMHALGDATEKYVGELLTDIDGADVEPQVVYGPNNESSIDWFLILPKALLLVEVKAVRPSLNAKIAADNYEQEFADRLDKAVRQIITTNSLLDTHPAFAHLPKDRPRIGVIVTGEPFYLPNRAFLAQVMAKSPIPILVGSVLDFERLSCHTADEVDSAFRAVTADAEQATWYLGSSIHQHLPAKQRVGRLGQTAIETTLSIIDDE